MAKTNEERADEIFMGGSTWKGPLIERIKKALDKAERRGRRKERKRYIKCPLWTEHEGGSVTMWGKFLSWEKKTPFDAEKVKMLIGEIAKASRKEGGSLEAGDDTMAKLQADYVDSSWRELLHELGIEDASPAT